MKISYVGKKLTKLTPRDCPIVGSVMTWTLYQFTVSSVFKQNAIENISGLKLGSLFSVSQMLVNTIASGKSNFLYINSEFKKIYKSTWFVDHARLIARLHCRQHRMPGTGYAPLLSTLFGSALSSSSSYSRQLSSGNPVVRFAWRASRRTAGRKNEGTKRRTMNETDSWPNHRRIVFTICSTAAGRQCMRSTGASSSILNHSAMPFPSECVADMTPARNVRTTADGDGRGTRARSPLWVGKPSLPENPALSGFSVKTFGIWVSQDF